jgi:hypothetical protein
VLEVSSDPQWLSWLFLAIYLYALYYISKYLPLTSKSIDEDDEWRRCTATTTF